tara:strand:- start:6867 stop:7433 length:567 start_codon:yes stop_codon:yes gene_type:complete
MELNEAIINIRVELQNSKLKQSGKNKFAGFTYFELSDFLPKLNELMLKHKVNDHISINKEYAELTLRLGAESQTYSIPFTVYQTPKNKQGGDSMQHIQYLGALNTYYKRYLYLNAFGITDGEVIDSIDNNNIKNEKPACAKQYSMNDIQELVKVKDFDLQLIENAYGKKLEQFNLMELNKSYKTLQGK